MARHHRRPSHYCGCGFLRSCLYQDGQFHNGRSRKCRQRITMARVSDCQCWKQECLHFAGFWYCIKRGDSDGGADITICTLPIIVSTFRSITDVLQLNGYWSVMFLGRWSMAQGWIEAIQRPFRNSHDFVSVDARRLSDPRNYEMLTSPPKAAYLPKSFDDLSTSPGVDQLSPRVWSPQPQQNSGYFGKEATYRSPSLSFSTPKPPSRSGSDARISSPQGRSQVAPTWQRQAVSPPPPILERKESGAGNARSGSALGANRSTSDLGREQSGSIPGWERSGSALATDRSGSALGRDWDLRSLHQRERTSPIPRRSNSALGRGDWDPVATYARGGATMSSE